MNPVYNFKAQVALVTGAAKGMGLAMAQMFAQSGASVVLADIDGDLAAREAERIVREGGTAMGIACDVAEEAQVAAMVDRAVAEYGRLDMAFNNAGIQVPPSDAPDISTPKNKHCGQAFAASGVQATHMRTGAQASGSAEKVVQNEDFGPPLDCPICKNR
jgi:NAD(P)-dependent dehydrogenase (short-subunit alcohol dehydrogenase family)